MEPLTISMITIAGVSVIGSLCACAGRWKKNKVTTKGIVKITITEENIETNANEMVNMPISMLFSGEKDDELLSISNSPGLNIKKELEDSKELSNSDTKGHNRTLSNSRNS